MPRKPILSASSVRACVRSSFQAVPYRKSGTGASRVGIARFCHETPLTTTARGRTVTTQRPHRRWAMAHGAFKVLDSDIHIIEPPDLWPRYIDPAFRERAPVGLTEDEGDLRLALAGKPWGRIAIDADRSRRRQGRNYALNQERWRPYAERGWTSKVQLEAMDIEGIDVAVVYPSRGLFALTIPDMEPRLGAAMTRAYNGWLHEFCPENPEQMLAAGAFCAGGILEKHPRLRVAFLEGNCSWVPFLLWRMDEHWEWLGDVYARELTMAPSAYFKRQCFVSVECDEEPVKHVIDAIGDDRIVFSTDFPHGDSKFPRAVESFLRLPISEESKRKILWDNCAAYYGLPS